MRNEKHYSVGQVHSPPADVDGPSISGHVATKQVQTVCWTMPADVSSGCMLSFAAMHLVVADHHKGQMPCTSAPLYISSTHLHSVDICTTLHSSTHSTDTAPQPPKHAPAPRYQRRRMYTRIALGENTAMDVLGGESSGSSGQLLVLYPLLFGMQPLPLTSTTHVSYACRDAGPADWHWAGHGQWHIQGVYAARGLFGACGQLYIMHTACCARLTSCLVQDLERHESDLWGNRTIFIAGACTAYMGFQNFLNTLITILHKHKAAKKRRARGSPSQHS